MNKFSTLVLLENEESAKNKILPQSRKKKIILKAPEAIEVEIDGEEFFNFKKKKNSINTNAHPSIATHTHTNTHISESSHGNSKDLDFHLQKTSKGIKFHSSDMAQK